MQALRARYRAMGRRIGVNVKTHYSTFITYIDSRNVTSAWELLRLLDESSYAPKHDTSDFYWKVVAARDWACANICRYLRAHCPVEDLMVDVFGWSRGAIAAMYVAAALARGCSCVPLKEPSSITVRFMGLIDPVDTNLQDTQRMIELREGLRVVDLVGVDFAPEPTVNAFPRRYFVTENVKSVDLVYAGVRTEVGEVVFLADQVVRARGSEAGDRVSEVPIAHEKLGFSATVRDQIWANFTEAVKRSGYRVR